MNIGLEFDGISADYTAKIMRWVPHYKHMVENLVTLLPDDLTPRNILDLGAGNGNVTALLRQRYPGADYTLLDASSEMLDECAIRFKANPVQMVHEMFQNARFDRDSLDLVVAGFSSHHLTGEEKETLFSEISGWLRPAGCFAIADLFVDKDDEPYHSEVLDGWHRDAMALGTTDEEWQWVMEHYRQYDHPSSFENHSKWLQGAGFATVKVVWRLDSWGNLLARMPAGA